MIYDLRVPTTTLNSVITLSQVVTNSETVVTLKSTLTSTFMTYHL